MDLSNRGQGQMYGIYFFCNKTVLFQQITMKDNLWNSLNRRVPYPKTFKTLVANLKDFEFFKKVLQLLFIFE